MADADFHSMKLSAVLDRLKARIGDGGSAALVDTVAMPTCNICHAVGRFNQAGQIVLEHDRGVHAAAVRKHLSDIKAPAKVSKAMTGSWYEGDGHSD